MDEMIIKSGFLTGLVSKVINKIVSKKLGCKVNLQLNNLTTKFDNGQVLIHIDADASMKQEDFAKIVIDKTL